MDWERSRALPTVVAARVARRQPTTRIRSAATALMPKSSSVVAMNCLMWVRVSGVMDGSCLRGRWGRPSSGYRLGDGADDRSGRDSDRDPRSYRRGPPQPMESPCASSPPCSSASPWSPAAEARTGPLPGTMWWPVGVEHVAGLAGWRRACGGFGRAWTGYAGGGGHFLDMLPVWRPFPRHALAGAANSSTCSGGGGHFFDLLA